MLVPVLGLDSGKYQIMHHAFISNGHALKLGIVEQGIEGQWEQQLHQLVPRSNGQPEVWVQVANY